MFERTQCSVTSRIRPNRLKASLLKAAVEDNRDTIAGRLPKRRRAGEPRRRWSHRAGIAGLSFVLIIAAVGLMRWPRSTQVASVRASSAETAPLSAGPVDPSIMSQTVSPNVLALGVRRVIIDAGHGGDNLGTAGPNGLIEKDLTVDIAERVRRLVRSEERRVGKEGGCGGGWGLW